jgi:16S rRNA (guanine527-N7)-methyltransferase
MTGVGGPIAAIDVDALVGACDTLGVTLTTDQIELFSRYAAELVEWNRRMNLTGVADPRGIAVRHIADCLVCLGAPPPRSGDSEALRCVDIGSGAGLPGVPLAIARPACSLLLVEATGKKARFLQHVAEVLPLPNVAVASRRVEDVGRDPDTRGHFDLAVSRAVASVAVLVEYAMPLLEVGGLLVALKGASGDEETREASDALATLGGAVVEIEPYSLPGVEGLRQRVVIEKVRPTPERYPRRAGVPARKPL